MEKIIVIGDTHGSWSPLNDLIHKQSPPVIFSVGDFGWFPNLHNSPYWNYWDQYAIYNHMTKIYFAPGNHDNWWNLLSKTKEGFTQKIKVMHNVYYIPVGNYISVPDFGNVMFFGGAVSIDQNTRMIGVDWFPQEVPPSSIAYNLPEVPIRAVISHTCPGIFKQNFLNENDPHWEGKYQDPVCAMLSYVWSRYKPEFWYFGHFHKEKVFRYEETKCFALNKAPVGRWWRYFTEGD
jgi:hypothetical protein